MTQFRNYTNRPGITEDYYKVRNFLHDLGYAEYTYARWDWMITHPFLDKEALKRIGIWEKEDKIVGLAIFDLQLGTAYCLTLPQFTFLKEEILKYSINNLGKDKDFGVMIPDTDYDFQNIATDLGFYATAARECDAIFYIDRSPTTYTLPSGFSLTSMNDTYDLHQYGRVLWNGFNHKLNGEGEYQFTDEVKQEVIAAMERPNVNLNLKIAITAPDGTFVSYCGMWYDAASEFAVIEPVATDPDYRKMGLGKAAVLEGIRRVAELGAKTVLVGSSQQFYYSIGMRPYTTTSLWKQR